MLAEAPLSVALGLCKPPIAAGSGSGGLKWDIVPRDADESIVVYRMESNDPAVRMPELGRSVVHAQGVFCVKERLMVTADFKPIVLAYGAALVAAILILGVVEAHVLWEVLLADLVATLVIFGFSRAYRNSSFYDAYWSVIPPVMAVYWLCFDAGGADPARKAVVLILVWLWGIRLTANWALGWQGPGHEDWRYGPIKQQAGRWGWLADFAGIHLFPTLIVYVSCLPIYAAVSLGERAWNLLDWCAVIITLGAILIELSADVQMRQFVANKKPGEIMKTGLWRYSRHPNYFGEMSFWLGLMVFGLAAHPAGWWWIMPGALAMTVMFFTVSVPLMDKRSLERRPEYADHMNKVSAIIPWFPKA